MLILRLVGIGWFVAISIAGGALLGYWLDGRLDSRPALTFTGLTLGLVVAIKGMVRMLRAVFSASAQPVTRRDSQSKGGQ